MRNLNPKCTKMKLTQQERRAFAASFLPRKQPPTVAQYYRQMNHEMWRTCNQCEDQFDLRKTEDQKYPTCGSDDLRPG